MPSVQANDLDGPIVLWTKGTLRQFPVLSVKLYEALTWQNIVSYFFVFCIGVAFIRTLLYLFHAFETIPFILLMTGIFFVSSALLETVVNHPLVVNARNRNLPSDSKSKEAFDSYIRISYSVQNSWNGVMQHRRLHNTQFAFELMVVFVVLIIVVPRISFDAFVWLTVLAFLVVPGIYHSWIASEAMPPPAGDSHQQAPPPVPDRPAFRNVGRYESNSVPASAFQHYREKHH